VALVGVINVVKKYIPHKQCQHLLGDPCKFIFNVLLFLRLCVFGTHVGLVHPLDKV
jgi:hypothetical protein